MMKKVLLNLGPRSYEIVIRPGGFAALPGMLRNLDVGEDAVLVTNNRVKTLYGSSLIKALKESGISVKTLTVPDSERSKSQKIAFRLIGQIAEYDVRRRIFMIALGGGVVGDLTGFVASIYKRGIPCIQIPTTLLAQVDAAIGGKTAINLPCGKNLVGTFHQPRLVYSNLATLLTLPERIFRSGLAEVVKHGVIADEALFDYLDANAGQILKREINSLEEIVYRSCRIKASVVSRDERETKMERTILNFGHTIGHAIEAATGYSSDYTHGEAVSIGMVCAADIAQNLGILMEGRAKRIEAVLRKMGLPTAITKKISVKSVLRAQERDKKIIRKENRFVLPIEIGHVGVFEGIPENAVASALKERIRV